MFWGFFFFHVETIVGNDETFVEEIAMPFVPSFIRRATDDAGQGIKTLLDENGEHTQAVGLVDENGAQIGGAANPVHIQGDAIAALQAAIEALGTLAQVLQVSGTVSIGNEPAVSINGPVDIGNKPEVSIPDPVTVEVQGQLTAVQQDIDMLTRLILNSPLLRTAIDGSNQLRTVPAVSIPISGTLQGVGFTGSNATINAPTNGAPANGTVYYMPVWTGPVDQRWELIQRANIEYNEAQRSKMAFS